MTIDLYDDVLMPFTIGLIILGSFIVIGGLMYLLIEESIIGAITISIFLFAWAVGLPIWRRHIYG